MYCRVIVDIVHENVAKPFTYLIPDGMELCAGQRVAVPFGAREKEGSRVSRRRKRGKAKRTIKKQTCALPAQQTVPCGRHKE